MISAIKYEKYPARSMMLVSLRGKLLNEEYFLKKREISNPMDNPMKRLKNSSFAKSSNIRKNVEVEKSVFVSRT